MQPTSSPSGDPVGQRPADQDGAGTLVLTATNTYTGGTTISAGTLQIGNGGTTGSLAGNVTNNAALAFNRSDRVTFGGVDFRYRFGEPIGSGTTTLGGVNTYTGGTTITAGTLAGSATSFGSGAITDNAALVIDQPAEAAFANAINGTGSFTKQGAGRLNYTGTGTLSGATTVAAGLLSVNGSLANSAVTVLSGASLGGTGTVGATTIQSGGTIAPGNSIGTLQVNGALHPGVRLDLSGRSRSQHQRLRPHRRHWHGDLAKRRRAQRDQNPSPAIIGWARSTPC